RLRRAQLREHDPVIRAVRRLEVRTLVVHPEVQDQAHSSSGAGLADTVVPRRGYAVDRQAGQDATTAAEGGDPLQPVGLVAVGTEDLRDVGQEAAVEVPVSASTQGTYLDGQTQLPQRLGDPAAAELVEEIHRPRDNDEGAARRNRRV